MSFGSIILTDNSSVLLMFLVDDVRHDVYLTLDHGVFNKGTKRADKNVEIDMEIIDEKEQIISVRSACC